MPSRRGAGMLAQIIQITIHDKDHRDRHWMPCDYLGMLDE